jgi:protease I
MGLQGKRGAMLVAPGFQDEEGVLPVFYLRDRGVRVTYVGLSKGDVKGKYGRQTARVEATIEEVQPSQFDCVIIPGGSAPEILRLNPRVLEFVKKFSEGPGILAAICHGPQVLISADLLRGKTATCYEGIRDDIRLAGAKYVDEPVVVDGRLLTARKPEDIPAFNRALEELLGRE